MDTGHGAHSVYVTHREMTERFDKHEEKQDRRLAEKLETVLVRVESIVQSRFTDFEKHFEKHNDERFKSYGHDIAKELAKLKADILKDIKAEIGSDSDISSKTNVKTELRAAMQGRYGWQIMVLAFAITFFGIVLILSNPPLRHFVLPFLPF